VEVSICEKLNAKRISVRFYDSIKPYKKIMLIYAVVPCLGERKEERRVLFFDNYEKVMNEYGSIHGLGKEFLQQNLL